jgi:hypothetical protein
VREETQRSTILLSDSPNSASGQNFAISMALTPDDSTLFISGNARILIVPVT